VTLLPKELSREFLLYYGVCPISVCATGQLRIAICADAPNRRVETGCDDRARIFHREVERVDFETGAFTQIVERLTSSNSTALLESDDDHHADTDARDLANQPPVIRYVNFLLQEAHDRGASDIHIEAGSARLTTRFRIDGVLVTAPEIPHDMGDAIVSRTKLLAGLDIAERRRPQDGRIRARLDERSLDLRVSTVPTYFGESVVIRLLDHGSVSPDLESLGMHEETLSTVSAVAMRSHGLILVTGPTGSGKTTTLYAALRRRDLTSEKVITVEDPVENQLSNVTQVPVNRLAGVTFASALRSILRQDPDVVMVGEMRDAETAEIALQAANTGHLVFSTVHTNDAAGAVIRIRDLGIPGFLLAASLELVLAQRLVRMICRSCREPYVPDPVLTTRLHRLGLQGASYVHGRGCRECNGTGYRGRTGVFELLSISPTIRAAIAANVTHADLRQLGMDEGMRPLVDTACDLVSNGITTIEEITRAVL
jgi:general secretion pathway protein E